MSARSGVELGSKNETQEERTERLKRSCQMKCDSANQAEGNLNEYDGYNCDICKNKGYILKPELYRGVYNEVQCTCRCTKIRKTIRSLKRSGLENVVHDYTFDKYIATEDWQKSVLDTAKRYIDESKNDWFFFGGATGAGKSHICTAIAISLLKQGKEVKYMLWQDESKNLKARVNDIDYGDLIEKYKTVDVLYIDDLFKTGKDGTQKKQRPTTGDINLAFEIINARYVGKKITIISSECTITDLIDIDEATAGRIKQKSGLYCLNIAPDRSKNYRLK